LQEWVGSSAPIFFDFGESSLWWFFAKDDVGPAYVAEFPRALFIQAHRTAEVRQFENYVEQIRIIANIGSAPRPQLFARDPLQPPRPRRHFRF
jgi:hypothetical protein